jgi:hypothetical protein
MSNFSAKGEKMKDWSAYTIKLTKLENEREKALTDNNLALAISLQGKIIEVNAELTLWMKDNYK